MAKDLFGGFGNLSGSLGGLVSGLAKSGFVPQDDPEVKLINAQTDLTDLKNQEAEVLVDIGRQAFAQNPDAWPHAAKLNLIRSNIVDAENKLNALNAERDAAQKEKEAMERAQEAEDAKKCCPSCGHINAEGINFCQECGAKLGAVFCGTCGAQLQPGIRFCGGCGARTGEA